MSSVKEILSLSRPDGVRFPLLRERYGDGRVLHYTVDGKASSAPAGDAPARAVDIEHWLREVVHCPICATPVGRARPVFDVGQWFHRVPVVACPTCDLRYKTRQATPELLGIIYGPAYTLHRPLAESDVISNLPRVDRLCRRAGRLLDYGCGNGQFVAAAAMRGWDAIGTDAYLKAPASSRQAKLDLRKIDACDPGAAQVLGSFDVITAWALVEHLPQPLSTLRALTSLLRPGGVLVFNAPNGSSWAARHHGTNWRLATALEHLHFITPSTVGYLAKELGLTCEKISICGSPLAWNSGDGGLRDQGVDRCWEEIGGMTTIPAGVPAREESTTAGDPLREISWKKSLRHSLRSLIGILRVGDHLEAFLEKPGVEAPPLHPLGARGR
jgi:2-polyprenyl-3-methyl-5-hydroxy-6-metoxy-1,4-benzoquinol methylase